MTRFPRRPLCAVPERGLSFSAAMNEETLPEFDAEETAENEVFALEDHEVEELLAGLG